MFKVGEKYLCKKSSTDIGNNFCIKKDICYELIYIQSHWFTFKANDYSMIFDDVELSNWYIYDYFYTNKEYRKQKLEKICLNQEI